MLKELKSSVTSRTTLSFSFLFKVHVEYSMYPPGLQYNAAFFNIAFCMDISPS